VTANGLELVLKVLDDVTDEVSSKHRAALAPAIEKVWEDAVISVRADLREWLRREAGHSDGWTPRRFELSFGIPTRMEADPASVMDPVLLDLGAGVRLLVRGAIDMVEQHADGSLRATDHKTGRPRASATTVVGGGETLQPVFYALVLERLFPGTHVEGGRLYYCTSAGGFESVERPLTLEARNSARRVVEIVRAHLARAFFPAAPARDACTWCDYKVVCGAGADKRQAQKSQRELQLLTVLRGLQ
jgi:CRISPR/Cas system-associated exonuclease Cas4 (RecB family)